jgi:hypothetical protein
VVKFLRLLDVGITIGVAAAIMTTYMRGDWAAMAKLTGSYLVHWWAIERFS